MSRYTITRYYDKGDREKYGGEVERIQKMERDGYTVSSISPVNGYQGSYLGVYVVYITPPNYSGEADEK